MSSEDRIEALERALTQVAELVVATATASAAQGVICRAVVELIARNPMTSVGEIAEFAVAMAAGMPTEIGAAVGSMLSEASPTPGGLH